MCPYKNTQPGVNLLRRTSFTLFLDGAQHLDAKASFKRARLCRAGEPTLCGLDSAHSDVQTIDMPPKRKRLPWVRNTFEALKGRATQLHLETSGGSNDLTEITALFGTQKERLRPKRSKQDRPSSPPQKRSNSHVKWEWLGFRIYFR